jgi:hypothetical protein
MNSSQRTQHGASAIVVIILLAVLGAGAYIGFQYIPQYIEASTVNSILNNLEKAHNRAPIRSVKTVREVIDKQLNMNQLDDLKDSFKITQGDGEYVIKVSFERDLNLIYRKKPMKYEKTLILRRQQ